MSADPDFAASWRSHRAYVVDLAFRMLGDVGDAEDIAQEAFVRLARTAPGEVADVRAWLTVVAGRLCLDLLRSARMRHESPNDPGLLDAGPTPRRAPDPADRVTLDDEVQAALLLTLQRLGPAERVAFILHDVFGVPFDAVSRTLGRPVNTCRQLARRARQKIADAARPPLPVVAAEHQALTERFIAACADGDLDTLLDVLHPDAWGVAGFVAGPLPAQRTLGAAAVAENLLRYFGPGMTLVSCPNPAGPTVLAYRDRRPFGVLVLTVAAGRVASVQATVDPS